MIKILSQNLINQIAAGEVIERPSSVIKELMENAIDARATEINVKIINAGKSFISISDNGIGMDKDSLQLCILSHATSKLSNENLFDIHTFGFRGEALPSIVSIARVSITSSNSNTNEAWCLQSNGKEQCSILPSTRIKGTTVEVQDLFFATPARLKFLKSDATESDACLQTFNRIALAFNKISFTFQEDNKKIISYPVENNLNQRICNIFGTTFFENVFPVDIKQDNFSLSGVIGVPTFNKSSSLYQYFFVNNRFVKDKIFTSALKVAYSGLVPHGRFPVAILFFSLPYSDVDVNAHPSKIEIRFRNSDKVRSFLITELKKAISSFGSKKSTTETIHNFYDNISQNFSDKNSASYVPSNISISNFSKIEKINTKDFGASIYQPHKIENYHLSEPKKTDENNPYTAYNLSKLSIQKNTEQTVFEQDTSNEIDLGNPLYQIANTYIVAANNDNLIIVDQHAAAERITLEKLQSFSKLESQNLLLPEMYPIKQSQLELLEKNKELINKFGIIYEILTSDMIMIQALPSILGHCDVKPLINDILDELETFGNVQTLQEKIQLMLSTISCHGSLRAGKKLSIEEMDSLLRQMEKTPNIAQCCHGRPSYITINYKILNKFFERY